jgi:hypothetical protein
MLLRYTHVVAQERKFSSFRYHLQEEGVTRTQFAQQTNKAEVKLFVDTMLIRHALPRTYSDAGKT